MIGFLLIKLQKDDVMKNYEMEIINLFSFQNKQLKASFYRPKQTEIHSTILYFHGGGLIFGDRDDLPNEYIELLATNGIALLALDYPLAPETKMPEILETVYKMTDWFVEDFLAHINNENYFIMGRSAGGFLALSTAIHAQNLTTPPKGVISLYGYYNLSDATFTVPNRHYLKYPLVNDRLISSFIQKGEVVTKGDQNRFLVYLASRQKGDWMNLLLTSSKQKQEFSIPRADLANLPPLFLAAATNDPDVPSRQTRQLANIHPNAMLTLYDLDEHDFDRTHQQTHGLPIYQKMVQWILSIV